MAAQRPVEGGSLFFALFAMNLFICALKRKKEKKMYKLFCMCNPCSWMGERLDLPGNETNLQLKKSLLTKKREIIS
jgi:hypothetical protein